MERSHKLLVVDDDPGASDWLAMFAARLGYEVEVVASGEAAVEAVRRAAPDLVTLDVMLPGISGIETLKALKQLAPTLPVIMLSGHGQTQTIVEAVRAGASDFLRKPFEPEQLELSFGKALARGPEEEEAAPAPGDRAATARGGRFDPPAVWGRGQNMQGVHEVIDHVADTDITVLVRGESGTGKDLVARSLHSKSGRRERPFVKVNCAALPSELLESELFGYEKGAFTGAQRQKLGICRTGCRSSRTSAWTTAGRPPRRSTRTRCSTCRRQRRKTRTTRVEFVRPQGRFGASARHAAPMCTNLCRGLKH